MNANNWSLDEMTQEVYIVPFSPDECQARLELLDQPQPRRYFRSHYQRYLSRTKVIKIGTVQTHVLYNVQRVHKWKYGFINNVYAELNVVFIPLGSGTQVEIYRPNRMTQSQKWWLARDLLLLLVAPLLVLSVSASFHNFAIALGVYVLAIGPFLYLDLTHFARARATLNHQVENALNLSNP